MSLWYHDVLSSIFLSFNHGDMLICSMMDVFIVCYCFLVSLCEAEVVCLWDTWLNHFWVSISYIWCAFQSLWEDWSIWFALDDVIVWHVLTWPFWSLWSVLFWDIFWLLVEDQWILWVTLGYVMVARWRTIGYCDLSLMPSVANRELLWSLWLLFDAYQLLMENWCDYCGLYLWCFPVACIGLRWFWFVISWA